MPHRRLPPSVAGAGYRATGPVQPLPAITLSQVDFGDRCRSVTGTEPVPRYLGRHRHRRHPTSAAAAAAVRCAWFAGASRRDLRGRHRGDPLAGADRAQPAVGTHASGPPDTRPPLAKLCPPTVRSGRADRAGASHAARPADRRSRLRHLLPGLRRAVATWDRALGHRRANSTSRTAPGSTSSPRSTRAGDYLATILSGSVPAATNDALTLDLKCTGHRSPPTSGPRTTRSPTRWTRSATRPTTLGGRPAWVSEFRLHFHAAGLRADRRTGGDRADRRRPAQRGDPLRLDPGHPPAVRLRDRRSCWHRCARPH